MAESANNGAASLAASMPIKVENISIPGFTSGKSNKAFNPTDYRVRYGKFSIGEPGENTELEIIETKGLLGEDIIVLNKQSFSFMDQYIMIVTYLERIGLVS